MFSILLLVASSTLTLTDGAFKFLDTSLSWDDRVDDLVSRLSIDEIQTQMGRAGFGSRGGPAPGIPRLGINPYSWNTECLRGDARAGSATAYPQSIGLAATWDLDLIERMAKAVSEEVRDKYNYFTQHHQYGDHKGLSCFSPVINIMRDPRWGRNQETYGEDPYLTGEIAKSYVKGLQGDHPRYISANAGCKHFNVHGGPENLEINRFRFDAKVSTRDWRMTFLPAFRACVQAGTLSLMCSYNRLNGIPACAHKELLTDILRTEWGFKGYVVSDQGAIEQIRTRHHYQSNPLDNAAASVGAGCNLELSQNLAKPDFFYIADAVKQGKLKESDVRARAKELFYVRMRLGEFDPPEMNPYSNVTHQVESKTHQDLAVEAASRSYVLLKNRNNFLPLKSKYNKAAVVGPFTYQGRAVFGSYAPNTEDKYISTTLDGLKGVATSVTSAEGCTDSPCHTYQEHMVTSAVKDAEIVFVCLGSGQKIEDEFVDRPTLDLPAGQQRLLKDVIGNTKSNIPIVLLLFNAGPVNIVKQESDDRIDAILELFYPAQANGKALLKILMNDGPFSVPAARLPFTWYKDLNGFPSITNYSMEGRTYRYYDNDPLYPFGYGLSYTTFSFSKLHLASSHVTPGHDVAVQVRVDNTGQYTADEVVQVYISWENATVPVPNLQLVAFTRVSVAANHHAIVKLTIHHEKLAVWVNSKDGWVIEPGTLRVYVGGQQPHQKKSVGSNVLESTLQITGRKVLGKY